MPWELQKLSNMAEQLGLSVRVRFALDAVLFIDAPYVHDVLKKFYLSSYSDRRRGYLLSEIYVKRQERFFQIFLFIGHKWRTELSSQLVKAVLVVTHTSAFPRFSRSRRDLHTD